VTREMQDTERALLRAEHDWLIARGWNAARPHSDRTRYAHKNAPKAREDYTARDAMAMTRAEPLRFISLTRGAFT
jgi:hypothetical protein